jgi:hypothetical protein
MSIRTWISPLVIAAALTFSNGASAQAVIDGFTIPEESMVEFQQKCQALVAAQNRSLTTDTEVDETETGSIEDSPQATDSDPAAVENELELLASLTPEQCEAAGLL